MAGAGVLALGVLVGVVEMKKGSVMVFGSNVIAPVSAKARPNIVAPVSRVMEA